LSIARRSSARLPDDDAPGCVGAVAPLTCREGVDEVVAAIIVYLLGTAMKYVEEAEMKLKEKF